MQPSPHRLQLFCFPHAGASALGYSRWQRRVSQDVRIVPVELPGRGRRWGEALCRDIGSVVDDLAGSLRREIAGPYALFGHSLGALLAFEVAHALRAGKTPIPVALFASGCSAPTLRDSDRYAAERSDAELIAELSDLGGTSAEILANAEWMAMTLPVLRADYRVCASYRPVPRLPLACPLHVFGGRDDETTRDRLAAWSSETSGPCTIDWFDGGHFFLHDAEAELLGLIVRYADQSLARQRSEESRAGQSDTVARL
ncbi:thioesterase II family protein [Methylolobus aquaticus]